MVLIQASEAFAASKQAQINNRRIHEEAKAEYLRKRDEEFSLRMTGIEAQIANAIAAGAMNTGFDIEEWEKSSFNDAEYSLVERIKAIIIEFGYNVYLSQEEDDQMGEKWTMLNVDWSQE